MTRTAVVTSLITGQIDELRRRRSTIKRGTPADKEQFKKDFGQIRQLIATGNATSGDAITDYFIVAHRSLDPADSQFLRDIETQMAERRGELFLVVRRKKQRGTLRCERALEFAITVPGAVEHILGTLAAEKLVLNAHMLSFGLPAGYFARVTAERTPELKKGPFIFGIRELVGIARKVHRGQGAGFAPRILVGDREVLSYALYGRDTAERSAAWKAAFRVAAMKLGKSIPDL
jgi:hypothetical protein